MRLSASYRSNRLDSILVSPVPPAGATAAARRCRRHSRRERQALVLNPDCVDAMVGLALARIYQVINLYRLARRDTLLGEAEALISRSSERAPNQHGVLKARALLLRARGKFAEAILATEAMIARNPAEPTAYKEMGSTSYISAQRRKRWIGFAAPTPWHRAIRSGGRGCKASGAR
jgi:hypothetical protein